ncbi:hypothetical protein VTN31DRAFT_5344 [Thermomyces dupontii]|uniref:uncharacterized protein n=1 Tax=Talaromyces thermophilus TaxID=28565 RepID=UPI0037427C4F
MQEGFRSIFPSRASQPGPLHLQSETAKSKYDLPNWVVVRDLRRVIFTGSVGVRRKRCKSLRSMTVEFLPYKFWCSGFSCDANMG